TSMWNRGETQMLQGVHMHLECRGSGVRQVTHLRIPAIPIREGSLGTDHMGMKDRKQTAGNSVV
ncbi:hypothetical protein BDN71DRAFT_1456007, partial [Pleurotus eryngii]